MRLGFKINQPLPSRQLADPLSGVPERGNNMKLNKISQEEAKKFERPGLSGQIYFPSEFKKGFNAMLITANGKHPRKKMIDTIRVYFIIEGEGIFSIDDKKYEIKSEELFVIEPGQEYEYDAKAKMFEFNVSPGNSFRDLKL